MCLVEQPKDLLALESTGLYRGVYHVLLGRISPLEGVEPGDLTIDPLMRRLASGAVREIIMGTNPNMEGDGTALYVVNYDSSTMSTVRTSDLAVIQTLPTNHHPIGITYEPTTRTVWVACYSGTILVFGAA